MMLTPLNFLFCKSSQFVSLDICENLFFANIHKCCLENSKFLLRTALVIAFKLK